MHKIWGMVIAAPNTEAYLRESKLGTGANPASAPAPRRYFQDDYTERVYPAEQALRQHYAGDSTGQEIRFESIVQVQAYVDEVLSWPWSLWKPWPCTVRPTTRAAPYYRSGIHLPVVPRAMRELVVLHELAHHLARQQRMDHGLLWQRAFADLLADVIGLAARERWRQCLREQGVDA